MNICLGTTLQINPSGTLPLKNQKFGGKLVICNLQPTKYDKKADLVISTYVDSIMEKVLKRLGIELPKYSVDNDPTKQKICELEWTIGSDVIKHVDKLYSEKIKAAKKRKSDATTPDDKSIKKSNPTKKEEICEKET